MVPLVDGERQLIDSKKLDANQADWRQGTLYHARHRVFDHAEYHADSACACDEAILMLLGNLDTLKFCRQQAEFLKESSKISSGSSKLTDLPNHVEEPAAREALERGVRHSEALETEAICICRTLIGIEGIGKAIAGDKDSV